MKSIIGQNISFLFPYSIFLVITGYFLVLYPKGEIHLYLNQFENSTLNILFYYLTFLGDGTAIVLLTFLFCFIRYRYALLMVISNSVSSGITQLLKHTLFSDVVRPKKYFEGTNLLNFIPGVENYSFNSFPSGHSTTAFTMFFCLALISKNKTIKFVMLFCALLVGFSRVYLSQHFLNDVYAGSLIGVICAFVTYLYLFSEEMSMKKWMNSNLLKSKN